MKVKFTELDNKVRPKDHIDDPSTPAPREIFASSAKWKWAAIRLSDGGTCTACRSPDGLIGARSRAAVAVTARDVKPILRMTLMFGSARLEQAVANDSGIPRNRSVGDHPCAEWARAIQGSGEQDRDPMPDHGVENPVHLVASHCKPWRDATNEERLNGENGLLLTPSIDHLFDRGFIGFEDNGRLIISPVAHLPSLQRMGIDTTKAINVGGFTSGQKQFLDFHRNDVLLKSIRS